MSSLKSLLKDNPLVFNYKRMWPFIKPYRFRALLGVLLTIPVGALDATIAAFLKPFMDNVMVDKEPQAFVIFPILIVVFTTVQGLINYFSGYINAWVGAKITIGVKRVLYQKLLSMDISYYDEHNSGHMLQRFAADADASAGGLINNLRLFLSKFFSTLALSVVLIYNSWQLSVFAIGVLFLILLPLRTVRKKVTTITQKSVVLGSDVNTTYNETYHGNKVIRAYNLEAFLLARFQQYMDRTFTLARQMVQGSSWISPVMHIITSIGVAVVVGYGGHLILNGTITSGNFAAFVGALLMLYTPLKSIGSNFITIQTSFLAIERVFEILNAKQKIGDNDGHKILTTIENSIKFSDVYFGYVADREILHGINLNINIGDTVALVGNSGGGKTTISSLIPRLYEVTNGEILIDGINIKEYTQESLRNNIAIVFQDNFLFSGTIRENIMLGNQHASEEALKQAVTNAYLDQFVNSLPNGLDTEIGERGVLVSGGQKQRIAIARAFVKDAPLVILDEATSALDNKAEKVVQHALDNLMKNRTVIVIAHRLSTVRNANKILVINDGYVVEEGTHEELLAKGEAYYVLYNSQFKEKEKTDDVEQK